MYKNIRLGFFIGLLLSAAQAFTQCEDCAENTDFIPGFCFTTELLPGKCAQFALGLDYFIYQVKAGKKTMKVDLPKELGFKGFMPFLEIKKLKAADILFIAQALQEWTVVGNKLRLQQTIDMLETTTYEMQASGLGIHILKRGSGELPPKGQRVTVHYRGFLSNGNIFDESYKTGKPFSFTLGATPRQVIKGWEEGIAKLTLGTRAILKIPPSLAYGDREVGRGAIPANSTLYFEIEVLK